jgi:hypothetical protein
MSAPLPTARMLEKLPMRAVVAYAARTARRLSAELRGIVADDILDDVLRLADSVSTTQLIGAIERGSVMSAAACVASAYAAAPPGVKSVAKRRMMGSVLHAAMVAEHAIDAAGDAILASWDMKCAALEAERAVRAIEDLSSSQAVNAATEAARRDYETLLREYGEHDEVTIGNPVDCFRDEGEEDKVSATVLNQVNS